MLRFLIALSAAYLGTTQLSADVPAGKDHANSIGMKLVRIDAGAFTMGQGETPPASRAEWNSRDWDEAPAHRVKISKPFFMGIHEVTNSQYERFDPAHKKLRERKDAAKGDDEPVTFVTWQQAVDFCDWLSKKEGKPYRLPTEAEWEYACRAGTTTALHYGDSVDSYSANFNGLSGYGTTRGGPFHRTTRHVGAYPANKFGLYDMHGNVMEWCSDWYAADYYAKSPKDDPTGPETGTEKVTRGGSWSNSGKACRSAVRTKLAPDSSHYGLGFRMVLMRSD
jgi:formylglycine-generating enzyme required for sulfatase activity